MDPRSFDVAVIGLGAVGSSALYQLARRGVRAVGIDRFAPPHDRGSSHGESRITRQAIGEGEAYVPLVLRSNAIWEELEVATGEKLLERCGFLFLTRDDAGTSHHGKAGFLERTRQAAEQFGIPHQLLDAKEIRHRFPQFTGLTDEQGYFEPGGGYLRPERCIAASLAGAAAAGAKILTGTRVGRIDRHSGSLTIETDGGPIMAQKAILATGGWISQLAPEPVARHVEVHRQLLHWFPVIDPTAYRPGATPTFIWTHGLDTKDQFYGFPPIDGAVKVAREDYAGAFDPDVEHSVPGPDDGIEMAARHVRGWLAGLTDQPARSQICHYAVTPDSDFLIDGDDLVLAVSACSGHGFKHAAAVGETVAQQVIGEASCIDLAPFGAGRFRQAERISAGSMA